MKQRPTYEELEVKIEELKKEVATLRAINKAFQKSDKEKAMILEGISKIVLFIDPDHKIVWANRAAAETNGQSAAVLAGIPCHEFWHHLSQPCNSCPLAEAFKSSGNSMAEITTPNGKIWNTKAFPLKGEEGEMLGVMQLAEEITVQKQTQEALRESLKKYRTILETIEEGYFETSLKGKLLFINEAFCTLTGYSRERVIGKHYSLFAPPKTAKYISDAYREIYKTGKRSRLMAYEYITGDGTIKSFEQSVSVVRDPQNKPIGFRGVIRDISERVRAEQEKKRLEDHLQQAQKMQAIGTLAGGIAHDFNNLLMGIQGNASLMLMDIGEGNPHHERLINIEKHVQSGAELTGQLLGFARGGKYEIRTIDVNELVRKTSRMFGRTRKDNKNQ